MNTQESRWNISIPNIRQNPPPSDSPKEVPSNPAKSTISSILKITEPLKVISTNPETTFFVKAPVMPDVYTPPLREGITNQTNELTTAIKNNLSVFQPNTDTNMVSQTLGTVDISNSGLESGASKFGDKAAAGIMKLGGKITSAADFATGAAPQATYDEFKKTMQAGSISTGVGDTGVVLKMNESGGIDVKNLEKVNLDVFEWINYAINRKNVGTDQDGKPIYIVVPDFADEEKDAELEANKKGLTDVKLFGSACAAGKKFDAEGRISKMGNLSKEEHAASNSLRDADNISSDPENAPDMSGNRTKPKKEDSHNTLGQATDSISNILENIRSSTAWRIINTNFKYIEYPFIYVRWLTKKLGIAFCRFITNILKAPESTTEERRLVISRMSSIFSLLFSILVTYNWFFIMFYKYQGERPNVPRFSSQMFKEKRPFVNFLLEFILYPLECANWFTVDWFPRQLDWWIPNNTVKFFAMYVICYNMVKNYGSAMVDLFYDSLKILFNHELKPWDDLLKHTYSNGDQFSITIKTYWFFHLLIFGGQVPSLIPSFYGAFKKAKEEGKSYGEQKYEELQTKAENFKQGVAEYRKEGEAKDESIAAQTAEAAGETDLSNLKNIIEGMKKGAVDPRVYVLMKDDSENKQTIKDELIYAFKQFHTEYNNLGQNILTGITHIDNAKLQEQKRNIMNRWKTIKTIMEKYFLTDLIHKSDPNNKAVFTEGIQYEKKCPVDDPKNRDVQISVFTNTLPKLYKNILDEGHIELQKDAWAEYVGYVEYCTGKKGWFGGGDGVDSSDEEDDIYYGGARKRRGNYIKSMAKGVGNATYEGAQQVGTAAYEGAIATGNAAYEGAQKVGTAAYEGAIATGNAIKAAPGAVARGTANLAIATGNAAYEGATSAASYTGRKAKEGASYAKDAAGYMASKAFKTDPDMFKKMGKSAAIGALGVAGGVLSGAKHMITDIIRFAISHYYVSISAMLVSLYLIFYSIFGIIACAGEGMSLFSTIHEIDMFIRMTSNVVDVDDVCDIPGKCRGTFFERLWANIWKNGKRLVYFMANNVYISMFMIILFFSGGKYYYGINSSTMFRNSMLVVNALLAIVILIAYSLMKYFKKTPDEKQIESLLRMGVEAPPKVDDTAHGSPHGMYGPPGYGPHGQPMQPGMQAQQQQSKGTVTEPIMTPKTNHVVKQATNTPAKSAVQSATKPVPTDVAKKDKVPVKQPVANMNTSATQSASSSTRQRSSSLSSIPVKSTSSAVPAPAAAVTPTPQAAPDKAAVAAAPVTAQSAIPAAAPEKAPVTAQSEIPAAPAAIQPPATSTAIVQSIPQKNKPLINTINKTPLSTIPELSGKEQYLEKRRKANIDKENAKIEAIKNDFEKQANLKQEPTDEIKRLESKATEKLNERRNERRKEKLKKQGEDARKAAEAAYLEDKKEQEDQKKARLNQLNNEQIAREQAAAAEKAAAEEAERNRKAAAEEAARKAAAEKAVAEEAARKAAAEKAAREAQAAKEAQAAREAQAAKEQADREQAAAAEKAAKEQADREQAAAAEKATNEQADRIREQLNAANKVLKEHLQNKQEYNNQLSNRSTPRSSRSPGYLNPTVSSLAKITPKYTPPSTPIMTPRTTPNTSRNTTPNASRQSTPRRR